MQVGYWACFEIGAMVGFRGWIGLDWLGFVGCGCVRFDSGSFVRVLIDIRLVCELRADFVVIASPQGEAIQKYSYWIASLCSQ
jgi:hypothetical protein